MRWGAQGFPQALLPQSRPADRKVQVCVVTEALNGWVGVSFSIRHHWIKVLKPKCQRTAMADKLTSLHTLILVLLVVFNHWHLHFGIVDAALQYPAIC